MLMRAATVVQRLCKSCRTWFMFYFTCDRSLTTWLSVLPAGWRRATGEISRPSVQLQIRTYDRMCQAFGAVRPSDLAERRCWLLQFKDYTKQSTGTQQYTVMPSLYTTLSSTLSQRTGRLWSCSRRDRWSWSSFLIFLTSQTAAYSI